jgi:RNA polymerase sigma-70 factor (ECF subfamily)
VSLSVHAALFMNELDLTAGDRVAEVTIVENLDALFRAHYSRLVRALTVVAGDREVAADAVQEAFVKAHLRWRRVQRYEDPVGWIRRVAINRLRDEHRRDSRKRRAIERLERTETRTVPVVQDTADRELMEMLASFPRQQRMCLALHYVDELSVAETAAALGISEGAVKFHLHQGRERLRAAGFGAEEDVR